MGIDLGSIIGIGVGSAPTESFFRILKHFALKRTRMIAIIIRHADFGKRAARLSIAFNPKPPFFLIPVEVKRRQFRKEIHGMIGQMIMDEPRQGSPVFGSFKLLQKGVHDNTGRCADMAVRIAPVVNMVGAIGFVSGAVKVVLIAELIDAWRAIP